MMSAINCINYLPSKLPSRKHSACLKQSACAKIAARYLLRGIGANYLHMLDYYPSAILPGMTQNRSPGRPGVPLLWCPSGCAALQAVENQRWNTGLNTMPDRSGQRWKHPALIRFTMLAPHEATAHQMVIRFIPNLLKLFPLRTKRLGCFAVSSPTRSEPFHPVKHRSENRT